MCVRSHDAKPKGNPSPKLSKPENQPAGGRHRGDNFRLSQTNQYNFKPINIGNIPNSNPCPKQSLSDNQPTGGLRLLSREREKEVFETGH